MDPYVQVALLFICKIKYGQHSFAHSHTPTHALTHIPSHIYTCMTQISCPFVVWKIYFESYLGSCKIFVQCIITMEILGTSKDMDSRGSWLGSQCGDRCGEGRMSGEMEAVWETFLWINWSPGSKKRMCCYRWASEGKLRASGFLRLGCPEWPHQARQWEQEVEVREAMPAWVVWRETASEAVTWESNFPLGVLIFLIQEFGNRLRRNLKDNLWVFEKNSRVGKLSIIWNKRFRKLQKKKESCVFCCGR